MDETLNALGGILLNAIPTFLLIIFLHFYLKAVFFKPMEKVLHEREEATAGALRRAQQSLAAAEEKAKQYEEAMRQARSEVYKEQELTRKQWQAEQSEQIAATAETTKAMVADAKQQIAAETETARQALEAESRWLADKIADMVLQGRAA
ncbi:MAG TPA: ATP synthase F0 subunit B [Bryobacteraceae bacterium]|nr:ATP synthase F0 subunit B [Bryobacteraceae bacterium]